MKEQNIQTLISIALSKLGIKIFRNNTGMGWAGKSTRISQSKTVRLDAGDVVVKNARPLKAGLCKGSSDLIGWKPTVITEDMVGKTIATFVAVEVKTPKGKATEEQLNFLSVVNQGGGVGFIATTADGIEEKLK